MTHALYLIILVSTHFRGAFKTCQFRKQSDIINFNRHGTSFGPVQGKGLLAALKHDISNLLTLMVGYTDIIVVGYSAIENFIGTRCTVYCGASWYIIIEVYSSRFLFQHL